MKMGSKKLITVQILNAFAENNQGGNPAGVVLNADGLTKENKLDIAKKVGLSETAFVSHSQNADYKLDFFTPTKQIAHCGHATIATFSYLRQLGELRKSESSKETIDGNRNIRLEGDLAFMEQRAPSYTSIEGKEEMALKSLGLTKNELVPGLPIKSVNTGNSFLMVSVKSNKILADLKPDFDTINALSKQLDLIGYYIFTSDTDNPNIDATTRMFAPRYGILEESGTGMAAGPLACYLYEIAKIKKNNFRIQQGRFMKVPSKSIIIVDLQLENEVIKSLMAGGKGILKDQMDIQINC